MGVLTDEEKNKLNALIAQHIFHLNVVALDWPCCHEPECGTLEAHRYPAEEVSEWGRCKKWPIYVPEHGVWPAERSEPLYEGDTGYLYVSVEPVLNYSTDIAAAWQVVEKMRATHTPHISERSPTTWQCSFEAKDGKHRFPIERPHDGDSAENAPTAPHAICLAALKAVGVEL